MVSPPRKPEAIPLLYCGHAQLPSLRPLFYGRSDNIQLHFDKQFDYRRLTLFYSTV
jgi:hypothetical protein